MFSQLSLLLSPCAFTIWILIIRVQTQLNLSLKFSVLTLNSFVISGDFLWCTLNYTASHERNGNEVTLWYVSWLPLKELRASGSFFCCARHFFGVEMNGRNLQSSFAGRRQDSYLFLRKPGGIKSEDMVAMPRAQGQGWEMQPFCGDALFLGLLKHRGTDRHWYGRAAAQSSLSGGGLPLTSQRSAWLFGERCESIRRTLLHTLMVKLLINYMIMSLDVFWRCWGYTVMFVEWYVCMFSDEFTVVFIAVKVQRGCSTSPLLYLLEKSWTTPCYSFFPLLC